MASGKRSKGTKKYFCPECGSDDTQPNWENAFAVDSGMYRNFRKCNECGYVGQLFTTEDDDKPYELEEIKEKISFGKRLKDNLWVVIVIILALIALALLV